MRKIDFIHLLEKNLVHRGYSMSRGVVAVTSLAVEARIALGAGVFVICSQGPQLAAAIKSAIKGGGSGIISFGVAGGLAPGLVEGHWIVASAVRTEQELFPTDWAWTRSLLERLPGAMHADIFGADAPVAYPSEKRLLHAQTGAAAVDMESHIAAKIAAAHRVPFVACRVIIDAVDKALPPAALVGLRPNGTADIVGVFRSILQKPGQLPALVRTALDARIASSALRRGRRMLGAGLGFPQFGDEMSDVQSIGSHRTERQWLQSKSGLGVASCGLRDRKCTEPARAGQGGKQRLATATASDNVFPLPSAYSPGASAKI